MSDQSESTEATTVTARTLQPALRPDIRAFVLIAILVAEIVTITFRGSWFVLLGREGGSYLLQVFIVLCVTSAVFAGDRIRRELVALRVAIGRRTFPWVALGCHFLFFFVFALFLRELVAHRVVESRYSPWRMACFLAAGLGAGCFWCLALMPLSVWRPLVVRLRTEIALVAAIGLAAWLSARYSEVLWAPLSDGTLAAVETILRAIFASVKVKAEQQIIGTSAFSVRIGPSCSGYEGFGLVTAVLIAHLCLNRSSLRFPAAFALLPLAWIASWVLNVVRIASLIAIGSWGWPNVAMDGFHTQAGWLAFNFVVLGTIALSNRSRLFRRDTAAVPRVAGGKPNPLAPYLVPFMALVATAMITGIFLDRGFDRFYGLRVLAAGFAVGIFRRTYRALGWSWSWRAIGAGALVFVVWIGSDSWFPSDEGARSIDGFTGLSSWEQAIWLATRIVGATIVVPLAEELAFRGYLLRALQGAEPDDDMSGRWNAFAIVGSSLVFGILHPAHWAAGTAAGVVYASVFVRRGRLSDAVLAHAVTNALLVIYVIGTGNWSVW